MFEAISKLNISFLGLGLVSLNATVMTSSSLIYLMGCSIASYNSYQVCYLQKRVVLTQATGDAELMLWDG